MNFTEQTLNEAKELGVSQELLKRMYNKGVAAWKGNAVPGSTPHQLGYAVVEQYLIMVREANEAEKANNDTTPEAKKDADKDKKNKKKVKYSNAQPGPTYNSSNSGGITAGFFGSITENALTGYQPNLIEWANNPETQRAYTKKYGAKAKHMLLQAVHKIAESQRPTLNVNEEPSDLVQLTESKRKNFELASWHSTQAKQYLENSAERKHHDDNCSVYNEKLKAHGKT